MSSTFPLTLRLTPTEILLCRDLARRIHGYAKSRGLKSRTKKSNDEMEVNEDLVIGLCGERAASIAIGVPMNTRPGLSEIADLGKFIEVRTRPNPKMADLGFRPGRDNPNRAYVLVLADERPVFTVVGWIWGYEAEGLGRFVPGRGNLPDTVYVPKEKLRCTSELCGVIHDRGDKRGANKIRPEYRERYERELGAGFGCTVLAEGLSYTPSGEPSVHQQPLHGRSKPQRKDEGLPKGRGGVVPPQQKAGRSRPKEPQDHPRQRGFTY